MLTQPTIQLFTINMDGFTSPLYINMHLQALPSPPVCIVHILLVLHLFTKTHNLREVVNKTLLSHNYISYVQVIRVHTLVNGNPNHLTGKKKHVCSYMHTTTRTHLPPLTRSIKLSYIIKKV